MEQTKKKMLPIGIDNFEKLRTNDYYYVDKTGLIRELLSNRAEVTLFTRPRRFGKSLNMSMLANFFSPDGDKQIFDGLEISKETNLCENYMGKYPVIALSLKDVDANDYEIAFRRMVRLIRRAALEAGYLLKDNKLEEQDKTDYRALLNLDMTEDVLGDSLNVLSKLLKKYHGKNVILLIDEYDVPLQRAFINGYYDRMVSLMRSMLGAALKTNTSLEFAVLTGCLRVSKESIFTGLNNLKVRSVTDVRFDEYFGFTDEEVRNLLSYYGYPDSYDTAKRWYDGYRFGNADVYCPWDVLNFCDSLLDRPNARPENYWINTSGNDAVKRFIGMADDTTREEIERLVAGETIEKEIREDLTYQDMYGSIDNLWSLLFATGYLTQQGEPDGGLFRLRIPNLEVRDVFVKQIREYFKENVCADGETLDRFCGALQHGDAGTVEQIFSQYLRRSISVRDTMARSEYKENFYHGVLLGVLLGKESWGAKSNRESGDGYADVLAKPEYGYAGLGIVIELKYAENGDLDAACRNALEQIEKKRYAESFLDEKVKTVLKYGIGCYRKTCKVVLGK